MMAARCPPIALALAIAAGCGASAAHPGSTSGGDQPAVDLALIGADGQRFALRDLRGRPVLLFVFTTYDEASQLALTPLTSFLSAHPQLQSLGIAAQPDPRELLPLYRDALDVRMPLAYEVEPHIVAGESALGPLPTVPTYVLLDARGGIAARHSGALTVQELEEFTEPVLP